MRDSGNMVLKMSLNQWDQMLSNSPRTDHYANNVPAPVKIISKGWDSTLKVVASSSLESMLIRRLGGKVKKGGLDYEFRSWTIIKKGRIVRLVLPPYIYFRGKQMARKLKTLSQKLCQQAVSLGILAWFSFWVFCQFQFLPSEDWEVASKLL